jgi:hypothetical protein
MPHAPRNADADAQPLDVRNHDGGDHFVQLFVHYRTGDDSPARVEEVGVVQDSVLKAHAEHLAEFLAVGPALAAWEPPFASTVWQHIAAASEPISKAIEQWVLPVIDLPLISPISSPENHKMPWAKVEHPRTWSAEQRDLVLALMQTVSSDSLHAALASGETIERLAKRMAASIPAVNELDDAVGPFYDTAGLVKWLGISKQGIAYKVENRSLLGVRSSDAHWLYPAYQFTDHGELLPRLKEILDAIDPENSNPWSTAIWLNQPMEKLGGKTPAEALRTDLADTVVATARRIRAALAS